MYETRILLIVSVLKDNVEKNLFLVAEIGLLIGPSVHEFDAKVP